MNKYNLIILLILATVVSCNNTKSGSSGNRYRKFDTLFTNQYKEGAFNGNVLIAEKGEVIFSKNYGVADIQSVREINSETVFELASVSKHFTAMGIVLLQKENKLLYNDEFSKYIPELSFYKGVTIHQLLIHTSGLPDYMELAEKYWDKTKIATNEDIIKIFEEVKPKQLFTTGTKWRYSNTGYLLLASIIERVSGKSFEQYLKEKIFIPLKMNNTYVYRRWYQPESPKNYAEGYVYSDSLKKVIMPSEISEYHMTKYLDGIVGDGMVSSNLSDMLKWDQALYTNSIVNENDKQLIFASYKINEKRKTNYGYGWQIYNSKKYGKIVSHGGEWAGYRTYFERHLDKKYTVIMLQNFSTPKTDIPVKNVRKILYNELIEKRVKVKTSVLEKYTGKFKNSNGREYKFLVKEGKLMCEIKPGFELELIPLSDEKFVLENAVPDTYFVFETDENGESEKCKFLQPDKGKAKELTRNN